MPTTVHYGLPIIDTSPGMGHDPLPQIRDFEVAVDAALAGPLALTSLGTGFNEPAQYSLGSTAALLQAAQGTHSVAIDAPVSTVFDPGVSLQFFRKNGSGIGIQSGYYLKAVHDAATDAYGIHQYTEFSADLAGSTGRNYNIHGVRSNVVLFTPNPGTNTVFGFAGWAQTQKYHYGYAVGYQVEANNLTLVDDQVDPLFGFPGSVGLMINMAGTAHATSAIHLQSGNGSVDAAFNGITTEPNALCRYLIDGRRALFTLQGTITFTNGSATISGSGTKFIKELHQGDTVIASGVAYTISSDPVSDTSATLTVVYAGTTAALSSVLKPVTPLRITANSYICSARVAALTDSASQLQYRLLGLNNSDQLSIDPDARGSIFGGFVGIGTAPLSTFHVASANSTTANRTSAWSLYSNDTVGFLMQLQKSRGTTIGSHVILASGDALGQVQALGSDGAAFQPAANFRFAVDGTPSVGVMPGRVEFWTTTAAGVFAEKMRLDNAGNLVIGATTAGAKLHAVSTTEQLRLGYDASNYSAFTVSSGGDLTIAPSGGDTTITGTLTASTSVSTPSLIAAANLTATPAGNWIFNPTGKHIDPLVNYDQNFGALDKKYLTLHAAELWVETLVAQDTLATIGGRILVGPTTQLTADLTTGATSITVKHNQMANGDRVYMEANGKVEFMAITSSPSGSGPYVYTVTRDLDGSGANAWNAGDAIFNTGQTGNGFIDLYSLRGVKSSSEIGPTIVGNVRNSATYNDWSEHWAIGNLNGKYGYSSTVFGVGLGKYASGTPHITIDATSGYRQYFGTSVVLYQVDASGNLKIGTNIASASSTNVYISNDGLTYNSEAFATGDVLLGDNTVASNKGNIKIAGGEIKIRRGVTDYITLNATEAQFTNLIKMKGTSSAIAIGSTPPTSASAGTGIWIDRDAMYLLDAGSLVAKLSADGSPPQFQRITSRVSLSNSISVEANGISGSTNGVVALNASSFTGGQTAAFNLTADSTPVQSARLYAASGTFNGFTVGANSAPNAMLDVRGTVAISEELTMANNKAIRLTDSGGSARVFGLLTSALGFTDQVVVGAAAVTGAGGGMLTLRAPSTTLYLMPGSGNAKLNGTAVRGTTEGTNHLDIFDGTAPVGTLANGISLYSTSGELRVMDSAGNATLLSPHDDEGNWIHDEINFKGRRLRVDMERLLKALDKLLGGGFIEEYTTNN